MRPEDGKYDASTMPLDGGRLCLDFVNTVDWRGDAYPRELLPAYPDLVAWAQHAGVLSTGSVQTLLELADRHPEAAAMTMRQAHALREALHRIFRAGWKREVPEAEDGECVDAAAVSRSAAWHLRPESDRWRWALRDGSRNPETAAVVLSGLLTPIAWSAVELLGSSELGRVKPCGDERCGWVFLDTSRVGNRRWCSMAGCGNRAKARRHYQRQSRERNPASAD